MVFCMHVGKATVRSQIKAKRTIDKYTYHRLHVRKYTVGASHQRHVLFICYLFYYFYLSQSLCLLGIHCPMPHIYCFPTHRRRRRQNAPEANALVLPAQDSVSSHLPSHELASSPKAKPAESPARRTAKAVLKLALELTEKALDGLPIPGVKGSLSGLLQIIEYIEVCLRERGFM